VLSYWNDQPGSLIKQQREKRVPMHRPSTGASTWQTRGGEARWPAQLESPNRSPRHLPADREPEPACHVCLSAVCRSAATASPLVRAGFHAPPRVKAAKRSGAPAGPGLDAGWYTGCARTGGSFVVNVVDRVTSVKSSYYTLFGRRQRRKRVSKGLTFDYT
jgi:hypothetical protein